MAEVGGWEAESNLAWGAKEPTLDDDNTVVEDGAPAVVGSGGALFAGAYPTRADDEATGEDGAPGEDGVPGALRDGAGVGVGVELEEGVFGELVAEVVVAHVGGEEGSAVEIGDEA